MPPIYRLADRPNVPPLLRGRYYYSEAETEPNRKVGDQVFLWSTSLRLPADITWLDPIAPDVEAALRHYLASFTPETNRQEGILSVAEILARDLSQLGSYITALSTPALGRAFWRYTQAEELVLAMNAVRTAPLSNTEEGAVHALWGSVLQYSHVLTEAEDELFN